MIDELKKISEDLNLIVIMKFGSHLYGTNTVDSDQDFKGIYMPTKSQIYLNKIPKTISFNSGNNKQKNSSEDIDIELYSIHNFLELAIRGETIAFDMLHCTDQNVIYNTTIWESILTSKHLFYTKNIKGFVGYCNKQAIKYGIKGDKLNTINQILQFLKRFDSGLRLNDIWDKLPKNNHARLLISPNEKFYEICGKKFQSTIKISYCIDILKQISNNYGQRVLLAKKNKGIDWKAISHALRYALQIKELFVSGNIQFPLKDAKLIKEVKLGLLSYENYVKPMLKQLLIAVQMLDQHHMPEQ